MTRYDRRTRAGFGLLLCLTLLALALMATPHTRTASGAFGQPAPSVHSPASLSVYAPGH